MAWLAARHAEESAALGDKTQALNSWGKAEEAFNIADPEEDRVWTRFLDQNRFDSYRIATYAKIGKLEEAQESAQSILSRLTQPDHKKAVIILEDIAVAHVSQGSVNEACRLAKNGLAVLRETEFTMWLPRFEALAQSLRRYQRQTPVREFLEDFSMTKHRFTASAH
jgi:tetratricopeptide (TPR) repeat protein